MSDEKPKAECLHDVVTRSRNGHWWCATPGCGTLFAPRNETLEEAAKLVDAAEEKAQEDVEGVVYGDPGGTSPAFPDDLGDRIRALKEINQ
jgi:hypothetical protein